MPKKLQLKQFYEDLKYFLELTPKDVLFIIGDWNAKEIPGISRFGPVGQNETGQRLIDLVKRKCWS